MLDICLRFGVFHLRGEASSPFVAFQGVFQIIATLGGVSGCPILVRHGEIVHGVRVLIIQSKSVLEALDGQVVVLHFLVRVTQIEIRHNCVSVRSDRTNVRLHGFLKSTLASKGEGEINVLKRCEVREQGKV